MSLGFHYFLTAPKVLTPGGMEGVDKLVREGERVLR